MMRSSLVALAAILFGAPQLMAQGPQAYEIPPVLAASDLLPVEWLQGPHHRVREAVPSDGYMNHFTIDSDFGVFECVGKVQVEVRIQEMGAIAKLAAVSRSDLFAEGMKRSIEAPVEAVKNIVDDPKESVKKLPKTVGHFFSKVGSSIESTAKKVSRKVAQNDDGMDGEDWAAAGRGIGSAAKSAAGFEKAKLDTARQLGVDPYTDNLRLQEEMDKVTWAFFAGGLPLRVGATVVSGGASMALTATKTIGLPEDIYDVTPGELALRDRQTLTALGVPAPVADEMFLNPAFSVSLRHEILATLSELPAGPGRAEIVNAIAQLEKRRQVEFVRMALRQLAKRHATQAYREVKPLGRLPGGLTNDGFLEVAAPVDHVSWTAEVASFVHRDESAEARKRLLITGTMSPAAAEGFSAAGWQVVSDKLVGP